VAKDRGDVRRPRLAGAVAGVELVHAGEQAGGVRAAGGGQVARQAARSDAISIVSQSAAR
jgi:hypothetical protein